MIKIKFVLPSIVLLFNAGIGAYAQHVPQLWSLTQNGGADGSGALFHYTPSTNSQVLDFSWPNETPGGGPVYTELTDGGNGKFYGVASEGGAYGKGVIFEWVLATNVYTKKFDFNGVDGENPFGSLTLSNGKLYGMTLLGGVNGHGVIFEWDPSTNIYTKKIDFNTIGGSEGEPFGTLTLLNGKFYGMTSGISSTGKGVIFEWDVATNIYTKKYNFYGIDGNSPNGSLLLSGGKFYGMTRLGGANDKGVIFEWDPSTNTYSKKIEFNGIDGSNPYGSLALFNGKFYGMTQQGGTNDKGVIFEWDLTSNTYNKKIDFIETNGSNPYGSLTLHDGKFYGMTQSGQASSYNGIIFEWDPSTNNFIKKFTFDYSTGAFPQGSLIQSGGKFYGLTRNGGLAGWGVIFEWTPATNNYVHVDLDLTPKGGYPTGSLAYNKGKFYGMTSRGGANGTGVIFEWNPYSKSYTKKMDFVEIYGHRPSGDLTFYNGKFYGITSSGGGINNAGVIFEWDPVTNNYSKKIAFDRTDGSSPFGSLIQYNGKFYGMTQRGGINNDGVIFEWDPSTNVYQKKIDFEDVAKGRYPKGFLALLGGKFYGVTEQGGASGHGAIFEWDPSTNIYSKKIDFDEINGRFPIGSLAVFDGKFYGMTYYGGNGGVGIIFEWNPSTNAFAKKIAFDIADKGSFPSGSLFLSGNKFYGMTQNGGAYGAGLLIDGYGVIFEWDPITNAFSKKLDFNAANGANPVYSQFIEVLSNHAPVLSNLPDPQKKCVTASGIANFTLIDVDSDVPVFTKNSSNQALLPLANISITNVGGNNYQVSYTIVAGLTGTTVVTITCNDGYDGEVSFNIELTANPSKPTIAANTIVPATPILSSSNNSGNQWYLNETFINGATAKTFAVKDIGQYKVKTTIDGCSSPFSDGVAFIVNPQTITFTGIPEKKMGDSSFSLSATSSSGLPVQFTTTSDKVTVSGSQVTIVKAGSVTISADQPGNNLFIGAPKSSQTFCINPLKPAISVNITVPAQPVLTSSSESGNQWYMNDNLIDGATEKTFAVKDIGIYKVKNSIDGCWSPLSESKTFIVNSQTISFTSIPEKKMGDPSFPLSATSSSGLPVQFTTTTDKVNISGSQVTIVKAGSVTISAEQPGNNLFSVAPKVSQTFCINPLKPAISVNITVPAQPVLTSSSESGNQWYMNDNLIDGATEKTFAVKGIGIYKVKNSIDGCWSPLSESKTFIVNPQTITFTSIPEKKMGDASFPLSATSYSGLAVQFTTLSDKITISGSQVTIVKAGSVMISAEQPGNNLFRGAPSVSQTFCVNPAKPVISVNITDSAQPTLTSSSEIGNQWYLNDNLIVGALEKTLVVKDKGIYKVRVVVDGCIGPVSEGESFIITGDVSDNTSEKVQLFPNPVQDCLTIQLFGFKENDDVNLMIVDGVGKIVTKEIGKGGKELSVDVKNYGNGIYYINMRQGSLTQRAKFIKK